MMNGVYKSPLSAVEDFITKWVEDNVYTFDVAEVIDVNDYPVDRMVTVQPLQLKRDSDGLLIEQAYIEKCPVLIPSNSEGFLSFPIRVGAKVVIGYNKGSIEEFTFGSNSDRYEPIAPVTWGSSQAVVISVIAQANGVDRPVSATDMELKFKESGLVIKENNDIMVDRPDVNITLTQGAYTITTPNVSIESSTGGTLTINSSSNTIINGCTVTPNGNVITASGTDLDAFKAEYDSHGHAVAGSTGTPSTPIPV